MKPALIDASIDMMICYYVGIKMGSIVPVEAVNEIAERITTFSDWETDFELSQMLLYCGDNVGADKYGTRLIEQYIKKHRTNFRLTDQDAQNHGKLFFRKILEDYLALSMQDQDPSKLMSLAEELEELFDFPEWVGDLWSRCDRVGTTESELRGVVAVVTGILNDL